MFNNDTNAGLITILCNKNHIYKSRMHLFNATYHLIPYDKLIFDEESAKIILSFYEKHKSKFII